MGEPSAADAPDSQLPSATNPRDHSRVQARTYRQGLISGLAMAAVLVLLAAFMAPDLQVRPREGPFAVWNLADRVVTVRLTGADGEALYDVPPGDIRVLVAPDTLGRVSALHVIDQACHRVPETGLSFSGTFSRGGQARVLADGVISITTRLPAEWVRDLAPGSTCSPEAGS